MEGEEEGEVRHKWARKSCGNFLTPLDRRAGPKAEVFFCCMLPASGVSPDGYEEGRGAGLQDSAGLTWPGLPFRFNDMAYADSFCCFQTQDLKDNLVSKTIFDEGRLTGRADEETYDRLSVLAS